MGMHDQRKCTCRQLSTDGRSDDATPSCHQRAFLHYYCPCFRKIEARPVITARPPDEIEN